MKTYTLTIPELIDFAKTFDTQEDDKNPCLEVEVERYMLHKNIHANEK